MRTIIGRLTFLVGVGFSICCVPATPVPSRAPELPPLAGPFVSVLAQSQWMAGSFRDEFDGSITWGASQSGQDMELSVSISCSSGVLGVSLIPGPAADWRVFAHGRVDFRFDDGEPRSEVFADEDDRLQLLAPVLESATVVTDAQAEAFVDLLIRQGAVLLLIERMIHAETLAVRVRTFPTGSAVDTFDLRSLPLVLAQTNCPGMPKVADAPPSFLIRERPGILSLG